MKTSKEIIDAIALIDQELFESSQEYSKLGQIDMLSSTGNQLDAEMNMLKGAREALKWCLNDKSKEFKLIR